VIGPSLFGTQFDAVGEIANGSDFEDRINGEPDLTVFEVGAIATKENQQ